MSDEERSYDVRLFKGPRLVPSHSCALRTVLRLSLAPVLSGQAVPGEPWLIEVALRAVPDHSEILGPPRITNLRRELGELAVRVRAGGRVVLEQSRSVNESLAVGLVALTRRLDPAEENWAFEIVPARAEPPARHVPEVSGAVVVDPGTASPPAFTVRRAEEPELPPFDPGDWGIDPVRTTAEVTALLAPEAARQLGRGLRFSRDLEEGGFLSGQPFRHPDDPERWIVVVHHVLPARFSGASRTHFTFTGDSFREMSRELTERFPGERLVGWYHTHLFPATDDFGLSTTDVDLHLDTFRRPWQVAALINLTEDARVLRCYARRDEELLLCPLGRRDERDGAVRFATAGFGLR
ncbi:JAB N-terminal domain-containing protein [Kitasatospora sp. NPDC056651]|uniref:JAB N-terminal domain-containing protein n=1 Tax=Kitasatospora sp. NPDC056651 TaxID=3345892 RepID=UPI003690430A